MRYILSIAAAGIYEYYNETGMNNFEGTGWKFFGHEIRDFDVGIFRIVFNASIFCAVMAFLSAAALLAINAGGGTSSKALQDEKKWLVRIFIISVLIFGVTSLINLIGGAGLDIVKSGT